MPAYFRSGCFPFAGPALMVSSDVMDLVALHDAVRTRLEVVSDHALRDRDPAAHLETLKQAAARLDALVAALPPDCDPMLRHYLERQSYTKALAWLEEQSPR
ncbi:MAG: hypothetical protein ACOYMS_13000 [Terrimicrobiaceae bacterium]